jgi:hypothetical protein
MTHAVIFDCELSGSSPKKHWMYELGATFHSLIEDRELRSIRLLVNRPQGKDWDEDTLQFLLKAPHFAETKARVDGGLELEARDAIRKFYDFLKSCYAESGHSMVVGSNRLDIDATWVNTYLTDHDLEPLHKICGFNNRPIDLNSFHQGVAQVPHCNVLDWIKYRGKGFDCAEAAFKHLGITRRPRTSKTHISDDDSKNQAEAHTMILDAIQKIRRMHQHPGCYPQYANGLHEYNQTMYAKLS